MIKPHAVHDGRYLPAVFSDAPDPINILIVHTNWRGAFDTLHLAALALSRMGMRVFDLDWKAEPHLFAESGGLDFRKVDEVARSLDAELVILFGANLGLDTPVSPDHLRTYVTYQISSVASLDTQQIERLTNCHLCYFAHRFSLERVPPPRGTWLPIGCELALGERVRPSPGYDPGSLVLFWNRNPNPKANIRQTWLAELERTGTKHQLLGRRWSEEAKPVDAYDAFRITKGLRFLLDHNADPFFPDRSFHLNDRFMMAIACSTPVLSWPCDDIDLCFARHEEYLPFDVSKGFVENVEATLRLPEYALREIAKRGYLRAQRDHAWTTRWAQILFDHAGRKLAQMPRR